MSDGLVGAISKTAAAIQRSAMSHDAWAIRLVFIAGFLTIVHKSGIEVPHYAKVFAVSLGVAALLYEMTATTHALRAFWSGRAISAGLWAFVWCVAFGYSINQWMGAASENEGGKTNVHQAAFLKSADVQGELTSAKAELERLDQRLRMAPQRTAEQAEQDINNAKSNRFWKVTDGCKETKGPQTRKFCDDYRSAEADKAGASEILTVREEQKLAKARYDKARAVVADTKVETSTGRNDLIILTKYAGMKESDAGIFNALASVMAVSIFLSLATFLKELEHLRATTPRTPIFKADGLWRWFNSFVFGKTVVTVKADPLPDHEARAALENLRRTLGVAFNPTATR
jgi:hypothetical protein